MSGGMPGESGVLAECADVRRSFGRFVAVDHVDLRLNGGEVVGLLGANGAGKTTLIRMLLGLLPVSAGEVRLFGEPPSRGTRQRIGRAESNKRGDRPEVVRGVGKQRLGNV